MQNLITLKILSLTINTLIPPLFPLFKTVLELLQSDSLQCLRCFFPHLHILKTLSFNSWKQEKIAGYQVWGVGGGVGNPCHPVFREKLPHTQCTPRTSEGRISQQLVSCEVLLLRFVDMSSTELQCFQLIDCLTTIKHYHIAIFFLFSSVLLVEGCPDRGWSSSDMSPRLNREIHS